METFELHRGRLIDHVQLVVADLATSRRFHEAVPGTLGVPLGASLGGSMADHVRADELFVSTSDSLAAQDRLTGRPPLAFQAEDRAAVEAFHVAGLAAGGRDTGTPGLRPDHPGSYAAFLLDPDGNTIKALHHGPAERSAASERIRF
ncbi:VOC family protein [Azorhizobium doebereinerae]|uniref:VOC family protein n=1 Tax=Azorhizobium doebereinerae TaxID=281091 RepID=UPI00042A4185|nr:VOC family protein [Azorhizobium doebereinerae]